MTAPRPLAAEWPARTADLLRTLYDVAEDHEADTLESLMLRGGYLWRCPDDDCRFVNACDDAACDGCGEPRPQGDGIVGRLEYLRGEIQAERISMSEVAELQGLADRIKSGDNELLEWAGVPEFPDDDPPAVGLTIHEKVIDADAMLDLLRHIIDQLEAGMTCGFHPGWELTDS